MELMNYHVDICDRSGSFKECGVVDELFLAIFFI